jgi:acetylornithine/N-succinyldiaminopimelate aminotransferase
MLMSAPHITQLTERNHGLIVWKKYLRRSQSGAFCFAPRTLSMIAAVLPTYNRAKISFERGEGMRVFTPEGEAFLDFGGGVAVTSCGHAHPHLVKALTDQAQKIWHTSNIYQMPGQEKLAQRLIDATFAVTVFFTNSGAEALECSIKMARK